MNKPFSCAPVDELHPPEHFEWGFIYLWTSLAGFSNCLDSRTRTSALQKPFQKLFSWPSVIENRNSTGLHGSTKKIKRGLVLIIVQTVTDHVVGTLCWVVKYWKLYRFVFWKAISYLRNGNLMFSKGVQTILRTFSILPKRKIYIPVIRYWWMQYTSLHLGHLKSCLVP